MHLFSNLPFRFKLAIPIVLLAIIMTGIAVIGVRNLSHLDQQSEKLAKELLPSLNLLLQADRDIYQAQVAERSMIFVTVNSDNYKLLLQQHSENIQQAFDRTTKFGVLTTSAENKKLLKEFQQRFAKWRSTTDEIVKQRSTDTRTGRSTAIDLSFGKGAKEFESAREIIDQLGAKVETNTSEARDTITHLGETSLQGQLASLAAGLLVCIIVAVAFPTLVTKPLNALLVRVEDIAHGEGDLTARIDVRSNDEIGKLGTAFNAFLEKLQNIIREVASSTEMVAQSADEVSTVTAETSNAIKRQHSATDQVATAVTEIAAAVQEVAKNAANAASSAHDADTNAHDGQNVVRDTITSIDGLSTVVLKASEVIKELEQESEHIGAVLDVIRGIAEQTNLLALNAAIEAARAGEQGRGFAVVADEVRTLASRTQNSTSEIQAMIEGLQTRAGNAVSAMEKGSEEAHSCVEIASKAGTALDAITLAITAISDMNTQIASAAEEESSVISDINRNVEGINSLSEDNETFAEQATNASEQLAQLAANLQRLVGQFKV